MTTTTPPPLDWTDLATQEPDDDDPPVPRPEPPAQPEPPTSDDACQAERARVLRHPAIAARLTQPPLRYTRPEAWSGYLPPDTWQGRHNDSPRRAALLAIITDAVKAEEGDAT